MSVLVFDGDGIELAKSGAPQSVGGHEMNVQSHNGYQVATFRDGNRAYAVTSDLPEGDMLKLVASAF